MQVEGIILFIVWAVFLRAVKNPSIWTVYNRIPVNPGHFTARGPGIKMWYGATQLLAKNCKFLRPIYPVFLQRKFAGAGNVKETAQTATTVYNNHGQTYQKKLFARQTYTKSNAFCHEKYFLFSREMSQPL